MLGQAIWWGCIALEILLLVRCVRGRLLARFPAFYSYIFFVCLQSLLRYCVYHWRPRLYLPTYWITEGLGVLIGCGVAFEVYRVGLRAYPGAARMARNLLALVFILVSTKAIVNTSNDPRWWLLATNRELELGLRTVQALAILALVVLFFFYSIPFGRNLRGVLLGYGMFIGESVIWLAVAPAVVKGPHGILFDLQPAWYFVPLGIWLVLLWSYAPSPEPSKAVELEQHYQKLAALTNGRLKEARGYLARAVRP